MVNNSNQGVLGLNLPARPGMALEEVCTPALIIELDSG